LPIYQEGIQWIFPRCKLKESELFSFKAAQKTNIEIGIAPNLLPWIMSTPMQGITDNFNYTNLH